MLKESGFAPLFVIVPIVLVIILGIGFGVFYAQNRTTESTQSEITEPATTESNEESTPQSIDSITAGAPEIESIEPSATPVSIQIKENTDKDKCVLLFETSYNLHGETENCM